MATYESLPVFQKPCLLIENCSDGTLKTCSEVLNQLSTILSPLNVIAITGPYRTGKSYLLNRLAGKQEGFLLGSTSEATTKGIWVWCRPHPKKPNELILLMDTEGLFDIMKGNEENDNWIFAISVLLSSTLVYNCFNTISQDGLSKLHYVTELTQRIKTKSRSSDKDGEDFFRIFPNFVWVVRDFHLRLVKDGQPITPDEFLAQALQLKKGAGKTVDDYNRPRQCITNFFEDKKCFMFPIPVTELKKMDELEKLSESELNPEFLSEAERFSSYINTKTFPKTASGQPIHGKMFCNLLQNYVSVIQRGEILCVEDAVKNMAEKENADALKVSVDVYTTQMNERLKSINSEKELSEAHLDCNRMALERFMAMSKLDEQQKYQSELQKEIERKFKEISLKKGMDGDGAESTKDKQIAKLTETVSHLQESQKKLTEEKENVLKELDRKIRQREDEEKKHKEQNEIQRQQLEKLRRDKEEQEKALKEIKEGGSSFAKFLHTTGSILTGTLKVALGTVGVIAYGALCAVGGATVGAIKGGEVCVSVSDTQPASVSVVPLGAAVGGLVGGVVGFGTGVYEAINWMCENIDL